MVSATVLLVVGLVFLLSHPGGGNTLTAVAETIASTTANSREQNSETLPFGIYSLSTANVATPDIHEQYRYDSLPTISRDRYIWIYCEYQPSAACSEAGVMYDILVDDEIYGGSIDPAVQAAQSCHETVCGTQGVGVPSIKNLHGVQCHNGDNRIGDSRVEWGNTCAGIYASYADSVRTWKKVMLREYIAEGLNTPDEAIWKYAPIGDCAAGSCNSPPHYILDMHNKIDMFRQR